MHHGRCTSAQLYKEVCALTHTRALRARANPGGMHAFPGHAYTPRRYTHPENKNKCKSTSNIDS